MDKLYNKKPEKEKQQLTTIAISKKNYLILKNMGYATESMNDVLEKILSKQSGVYHINV